jgi:hypothetical protein
MDAVEQLLRLLGEWRRLTEREGGAILAEDWLALSRHQAAKAQLCQDITLALSGVPAGRRGSAVGDTPPAESISSLATELMALETRHRDLLRAKRQSTQAELDRVSQSTRHLQGVRRAYSPACRHLWQSYS